MTALLALLIGVLRVNGDTAMLLQYVAVGIIVMIAVAVMVRKLVRIIRRSSRRGGGDAFCAGCTLSDACRHKGGHTSCSRHSSKSDDGSCCGCH